MRLAPAAPLAIGLALAACAPRAPRAQTPAPAAAPAARYHAVADARFAGADGDAVGGVRTFRTIGAAIASLPPNGAERQTVLVRRGRYREKLTVELPRLTLVGEGRDSTVLTYDAYASQPTPTGGTWGTRNSGTLRVVAPDFRAEHLTVENAFDYLANMRKPAGDPTKVAGAQGVALTLDLGSDRAAFVDVRLRGHQDTLFPNAGRSWFYRSVVEGSVDFIFGAGVAVFEECDVVSRDRFSGNNGYITAASTPAAQPAGFLFVRSRLVKESPAMRANSVALGRPWRPYADPSLRPMVVFVDTWMDDHVGARGWDRMGMTDSTGRRLWSEPLDARFYEVRSTGPGAVPGPNRRVLAGPEAARHTVAAALGDWTPRPGAAARAAR
jgi:pectinesterase